MHPARIAELLQPFLCATSSHSESAKAGEESAVLAAPQLNSISTYIDMILRWNARINLTAIRGEEEIVTRHFGESLFAARKLFPSAERSAASRVADLGSGAGFPGIPIRIWAPNVALTLIESNYRKVAFLREVARALILTDIDIQNVRAETLPAATFDVVTLRRRALRGIAPNSFQPAHSRRAACNPDWRIPSRYCPFYSADFCLGFSGTHTWGEIPRVFDGNSRTIDVNKWSGIALFNVNMAIIQR